MAPEVATDGARAATIASDIYDLGAVLYELLAGRPPYASKSYSDFLRQIERGDPVAPLTVRTGSRQSTVPTGPAQSPNSPFDRDLELICLHCLQRSPVKRYSSAGALADDLERLLRGEPIGVRAPRPYELAAGWLRRNKLGAVAGLAVALSLLAGLATTLWQLRRAEHFLVEAQQSNGELIRQNVRQSLQSFEAKSVDEFRRGALHELTLLHRRYPTNRLVATRLWTVLLERPHYLRSLPALLHEGEVYHTEFLADGLHLLTGSVESTQSVYLWNLASGKLRGKVPHDFSRMLIAKDRRGNRLVTLDGKGRVHVWTLPDLTEIAGPWVDFPNANQAAISPSGAFLAATSDEQRLATWEVATGLPVWQAAVEPGPNQIAITADDRLLLVTGKTGSGTVYSTLGGKIVSQLEATVGPVRQVVAAPAGSGFLRVGERAVVFEAGEGINSRSFHWKLTNETVSVARLSSDGRAVALATSRGWLREYSLQSGEPTHRQVALGGGTDGLGYSARDAEIVVTTGDGIAWFFPADPQKPRPEPIKAGVFAQDAQFSEDGRSVALAVSERYVHLFREPPRLQEEPERGVESNVVKWAVSPAGDSVAILDSDGRVGLRQLKPGARFEPWTQFEAEVKSVEFSPMGQWLMIRDNSGRAWLMATSHPERPRIELTHDQPLRPAFAFSPDEQRVVLATASQIHVWNLTEPQPRRQTVVDEPMVRALVFSPDGTRLAFSTVQIWEGQLYDTRTWTVLPRRLSHSGPVDQFQFSQDSRWIATGSQDRTARVWRALDGLPVSPVFLNGFDGLCLAFQPSGQELYTGGWKGSIRRWQTPGGDPDPRDFAAVKPPHFLTCSADGRSLLSAGGGFTQAWDLESGTSLVDPIRVRETNPPWAMRPPRFTPDGKHLMIVEPPEMEGSLSDAGTLSIIRLPENEGVPESGALLALAQLCLDGLLNEAGGLAELDSRALAQLYRQAEPLLQVTQPSRMQQLRFLKPETH